MALFRCAQCHAVYTDYYPPDDSCIKCHQGTIRIITTNKEETTMTPITPDLKLHTHQDNAGIHISSIIFEHKGHLYHLQAATKDSVYIFSQSIALYALTVSREYGTLGLQAFMSPEPFPLNSFYLHSPKRIMEVFGPKWEQVPALDMTMKLIDYLI